MEHALSCIGDNALLSRSTIYSGLSIAYAQDHTQDDFESNARGYAELAHMTMPDFPELDPFYPCFDMGQVVLTEESYTSRASLLDLDKIPVYDPKRTDKPKFSGKRIKRGLYRASDGRLINADINGAGNMIRKVAPNAFQQAEGVEDGKARFSHALVVHPVRLVIPRRNRKRNPSS